MSRSITVTYELNPPPQTTFDGLSRNRILTFPAPNIASGKGENSKYYDNLRTAVAQAKDAVGEDLTAWRDAVGNLEQAKEPKKSKDSEDDVDEGDEGVE